MKYSIIFTLFIINNLYKCQNLTEPTTTTISSDQFNGTLTSTYLQELFDPSSVKINLSNKNITDIDKLAFENFTALKLLDLSNNQIKMIKDLEYLDKISSLDLSSNLIERFDFNIFKESNDLAALILNNNKLEVIEEKAFENINFLIKLNLENNQLYNQLANNSFSSLTLLEDLNLSNNKFDTIDMRIFQSLTELSELDLSDNYISSIRKEDLKDKLSKLSIVDFSGNPIAKKNSVNGQIKQMFRNDCRVILNKNRLN